jgi:hypothetical protein
VADSFSPADQPGDQADWWRAYVLAQDGQVDELRRLANSGDDHARRQLAGLLADRVETAGAIEAIRPLADWGDRKCQAGLTRRLVREGRRDEVRQRAERGDEYARHWLSESPS